MANRPFSKLRIDQLEAIFENDENDAETRVLLLYELKNHRKTRRAGKLCQRIEKTHANGAPNSRGTAPTLFPKDHKATNSISTTTKPPVSPPVTPSPNSMGNVRSPSLPKPPVTNKAEQILSAWMALEVLSPQVYRREVDLVAGQKQRISYLDNSPLPWERGQRSRPKKKLYYELVLGSINMTPAVEQLLKVYSDSHPNPPKVSGYCPLASIMLDKQGRPVPDSTGATDLPPITSPFLMRVSS